MLAKMSATVAAATLLLAACADRPTTGPEKTVAIVPLAAKGATPISLSIDAASDPELYRILGDGSGAYVDGQLGVVAQIDNAGNLQFYSIAAPLMRRLVFDFGAPAGATSVAHGGEADETGFKILTNPNLANGTTSPRLGDLGMNGSVASACYSLTAIHTHPGTRYDAWYNVAKSAQSSQVRITRTSTAAPSAWTVVSGDATCSPNVDVAAVYTQSLTIRNAPMVYQGTYALPFTLTLTAR